MIINWLATITKQGRKRKKECEIPCFKDTKWNGAVRSAPLNETNLLVINLFLIARPIQIIAGV